MKKVLIVGLIGMLGLMMPWAIRAQEASPGASLDLNLEIVQLNEIYRGQLAEYRAAEKEFQIARDQYRQLQTLASINAVTEATREAMKLRAQVILTYMELLRVNLIAAEGVEISLKQLVIERLTVEQEWLQSHLQAIAAGTDREQFNQLADIFAGKQQGIQTVSQEAVSLLSVGKLQNVFDRLAALSEEVAASGASSSAITQSRELRETERTVAATRTSFQNLWTELNTTIREGKVAGFYDNLAKALNPVYTELNKLTSYLTELLRMR